MKSVLTILALWLTSITTVIADSDLVYGANPNLTFTYQGDEFDASSKEKIENIVAIAERDTRFFFPNMNKKINFVISTADFDLSAVGHATGITLRHKGIANVELKLSTFNGVNLDIAIADGLRSLVLHELHHVARGWAMEDNVFPRGIYIATVNEGLAVVFAELLTGNTYEANRGPEEVASWVNEILVLPQNANYMHWVSGIHPDGRSAIGYKAGRHIIYTALVNGNKNIVQLSKMTIHDILEEAGITPPKHD